MESYYQRCNQRWCYYVLIMGIFEVVQSTPITKQNGHKSMETKVSDCMFLNKDSFILGPKL